MQLSIVGSGYVGTTIAASFADLGHSVVNIDIDEGIVSSINCGEAPLHEPGLGDLVSRHAGAGGTGNLTATSDYEAIRDTSVTFLCLPTPQTEDGSIDLSYIQAGAERVGETISEKSGFHTVVVKSTVVPGTTSDTVAPLIEGASGRSVGESLGMGMNPEFLREGSAVSDFRNPDKVVLGATDEQTRSVLGNVFAPLLEAADDPPVVETDPTTAEMIKYANNGFLASKISLINDIGNICKEFDIDTYEVADAIALDDRIDGDFLRSGLGFGGSCFPKDVEAIIQAAQSTGYHPEMLQSALNVNDQQPERLLNLLDEHVDVRGERVAVLGLSFKPGTDDVRNSRAIPLIEGLNERDANVVGYDPVATENMRSVLPEIEYVETPKEALTGAIACLIATAWPEFEVLDEAFDEMESQLVLDGRHCITPQPEMTYVGLTW